MSGDRAGKLGFGTEDIGLAAAAKPTHLLSWHADIEFHPNNAMCLETNMTPKHLKCISAESVGSTEYKAYKYRFYKWRLNLCLCFKCFEIVNTHCLFGV